LRSSLSCRALSIRASTSSREIVNLLVHVPRLRLAVWVGHESDAHAAVLLALANRFYVNALRQER
jgi:hypothetical protein